MSFSLEPIKTILCLGAHSDDIEIGCGGTVLRLLKENDGCSVHWIVFSSTDERAREAETSAQRFLSSAGESTVEVHRFRDGFFPYDGGRIKSYFEELKSRVSPDLVLTHYRDDLHQDHRKINELTWNTFRGHTILEYEIPKWDGDMGAPNCFVPLTSAVCKEKVKILADSFPSQSDKRWFSEDTFMALMRLRGMECNAPEDYAEAFYARKVII